MTPFDIGSHQGKGNTVMWHVLENIDSIPTGGMAVRQIGGWRLLIVRTAARLYVLEDFCPHQERTLHGGDLIGEEISCPWHSVQIALSSGAVTNDMGFLGMPDVRVFPIKEEHAQVLVDLPPGGRPPST